MRFEVRDSGIGMTEEQLGRVFEPFVQASTGTTRRYGGTGLGLALSMQFVESMGGKLQAESSPGLGSKFFFTLHFDTVAVDDEGAPRSAAPIVLARPTLRGNVLVCEDNRTNQEVIGNHLARVGLQVAMAPNGKQGVALAQARMQNGNPFDLILMDIYMPVMDGLEATKKLAELGNQAPIVAVTANAVDTDLAKYIAAGMTDYISKPFTTQELWACLLRYLPTADGKPPVQMAVPAKAAPQNVEPVPFEATISPAQPKADILDTAAGLASALGDKALYDKICRGFADDFRGAAADMRIMLQVGDMVKLHRTAHSMKSAARTIGAVPLAETARQIEEAVTDGDTAQLGAFIETLGEAFARLLPLLPAEEASPQDSSYAGETAEMLHTAQAGIFIDSLAPLLKAGDVECLRYTDEARALLSPLGTVCDNLVGLIEAMEFDEAHQLLTVMREMIEEQVTINT